MAKEPTGVKVSAPTQRGVLKFKFTLKGAGSPESPPLRVPIGAGMTVAQKQQKIIDYINNYTIAGNKPFVATPNGTGGITIKDDAGNNLRNIDPRDTTGQKDFDVTEVTVPRGRSTGRLELPGVPTGLDGNGQPAFATAGLTGVFVATVSTQGMESGTDILIALRNDLQANGIPAELKDCGLELPLDLPSAVAFHFGTSDEGLIAGASFI
jgi:hypothetical protein